jgi:hypothetical protein
MENQIEHRALSRKFRRPLTNMRNKRVADINSDHHLVDADFQMRIVANRRKFEQRNKQFDVRKLRDEQKQEDF